MELELKMTAAASKGFTDAFNVFRRSEFSRRWHWLVFRAVWKSLLLVIILNRCFYEKRKLVREEIMRHVHVAKNDKFRKYRSGEFLGNGCCVKRMWQWGYTSKFRWYWGRPQQKLRFKKNLVSTLIFGMLEQDEDVVLAARASFCSTCTACMRKTTPASYAYISEMQLCENWNCLWSSEASFLVVENLFIRGEESR